MANTLKLGAGKWATGTDTVLAFNDENNNFKPLPFSFSRASSATVVNQSGLIETVGSGEPRIDFLGNTKGALLLEPTRTNYIYPSTNLADWASFVSSGTVTRTNEYGLSPDGTNSATRIQMSGGNAIQWTYQNISSSVTFVSFYAKATSENEQYFRLFWNNFSNASDLIATNEWKRFEVAVSQGSTLPIGITTHSNLSASDILIWGFQGESGSYPTSYIPTSGSAVTRVTDACNNGANEQVINSTEGVLYAEISALADDLSNRAISLSDGSLNNGVQMFYYNVSNRIRFRVYASGVLQGTINKIFSGITITDNHKIALKWESGFMSVFVDGVIVGTGLAISSTPTGLDRLNFNLGQGSSLFYGNVKDVRVYNTALTDAELASLTTI